MHCDPDRTVARFRNILAEANALYDGACRFGSPPRLRETRSRMVTPDALVLTTYLPSRPYMLKEKGGAKSG
jgi:hypothetical protein